MISIKLAAVLLLIWYWFFDNVYLVRCSPGPGDTSQSSISAESENYEELFKNKVTMEYVERNSAAFAFQGYRETMEDTFVIQKNFDHGFSLFAIFDGHGGDFAAEYAKNNLIEELKNRIVGVKQCIKDQQNIGANAIFKKYININYETLLKKEILEFDRLLIGELLRKKNKSGTTATIALIDEEEKQLWVANVGDSRAVMCDSKGNAVAPSVDHKVNNNEERSRIEKAGGIVSTVWGVLRLNKIIILSRALGDAGDMKDNKQLIADPYITHVDLSTDPPKFLILATDGLWDVFKNEDVVAYIQENFMSLSQSPINIVKTITKNAYILGSSDNITTIIINLA